MQSALDATEEDLVLVCGRMANCRDLKSLIRELQVELLLFTSDLKHFELRVGVDRDQMGPKWEDQFDVGFMTTKSMLQLRSSSPSVNQFSGGRIDMVGV